MRSGSIRLTAAVALALVLPPFIVPAPVVARQMATASARAFDAAALDRTVERARKVFDVPGIAVAVVKDGKVVYAKGSGVRTMGKPDAVDADTLFGIASNSKAFTATALAMLVDEGKLSWDDPVAKHLPGFQLADPYVSRELTVRDLLTHRSGLGLGAGDLMWWPTTTFSREEILQRFRYLKPVTSFRSAFAYDNVLYLAAGQVVAAVSGMSWDAFVKTRIFAPLGMTRANTSVHDNAAAGNVATPHAADYADDKLRPIEGFVVDNIGPAASINASVNDLAKWMIVQLDRGRIGGKTSDKRLFTDARSREMWAAQTVIPVGDPEPPLAGLRSNFRAYGLGWFLGDYRGTKVAWHTGGLAGYVSRTTLVPDLDLGVVVLTNAESGEAFSAVTYAALDPFMGVPETDWVGAFDTVRRDGIARAAEAQAKVNQARRTDSKPSLAIEKYAGTYRDAWYGDMTIVIESGKPVLRFSRTPSLVADLVHWQYDTFVARWRDRTLNADAYVTFSLNPDGSIERVRMEAVSSRTDFSYDFHDLLFTPAK